MRKAIHDVDPDLPVDQLMTYEHYLHHSFIGLTYVVVAMGGIMLLLGALGICGVFAIGVQERTREIGVRMALWASRAHVRRRALISGGRLFGFGAMIGIPCAVFLAGAAAFRASLPAMRAASVDPVRALRSE